MTETFCYELQGKPVYTFVLRNEKASVTLTNLGAAIIAIHMPDREGRIENIAAGFEDLRDYEKNPDYFGCIVGRYANRIANGQFVLDGQIVRLPLNDGVNHLHGGVEGFHKKVWGLHSLIREGEETGVVLEYFSEDGEEGYPGNLRVKVSYMLNSRNALSIRYSAETDKRTPVNLTNHSYFNLTAFKDPLIYGHMLDIQALQYTRKSERNVPTGDLLPLVDTPLDFLTPRPIGESIDQLVADHGYDHNYVLIRHFPGEVVPAAELYEPVSGRVLRVFTDQPGIQLYTANWWDGSQRGPQGKPYGKHGAVALETQAFPDSPNHPAFPDTILGPGDVYRSVTIYEFGVKG